MDTRSIIVNLGCGNSPVIGALNVDLHEGDHVDVVADAQALPFKDGSITCYTAHHVLEHVRDFALVMRELFRTLAPGGTLIARVPYGLKSLYNPFHRRPFDEYSIELLRRESPDLEREASRWRIVNMQALRDEPWPLTLLGLRGGAKTELFFILEAVKA